MYDESYVTAFLEKILHAAYEYLKEGRTLNNVIIWIQDELSIRGCKKSKEEIEECLKEKMYI